MSRIRIKSGGAIVLSDGISVDGFSYDSPIRVQTHIHADHLLDFNTSKANQTIITSPETKALLVAIYNADLPHRTNLVALPHGEPRFTRDAILELLPSNHMLGCSQVKVTALDGYRTGYSSDFFWPTEEVIEVDELVVDSTYGDPSKVRAFSQQQVDDQLIALVCGALRQGRCVAVIGHVGRLHYALHLLGPDLAVPIVASPRALRLVDVYTRYGFRMPDVFASDTDAGSSILRSRVQCVAFVSLPERRHMPWVDRMSKITLSAYMHSSSEPVLDYGNGDFALSLTDHADFEGTLAYVSATRARQVWTDPRSGDAETLATELRRQLGVEAQVAIRETGQGWG